jgi:DNA-binding response OmpR family regulator
MRLLIVDDEKSQYGKFIKNLRNQNPDIQVKIVPSAIEALAEFETRTPDLIILDQCMGGGEKDGTAFLRKLKECCPSAKIPEIIFVTANYNELPTGEILIIDVPITLFLAKDPPSFQDALLVATQLVMRRMDDKVRYDPKDLFGDRFIKLILDESTEIIRREHAGYYTIDQQRQIGTLVRSYINSLEMRSRWDADDVLELSIFLAQSLCGVFKLPTDLIEVLRRFLNLEDVLYTIPHYRDHFFHQIKVFLLGFCIINTLNRHGRLRNTMLEGSNGMKLWFMASVFHDIGYPFEKMTRWLDSFVESTLRSPGDKERDKPLLPMDFHWGALLGKRFHAYHLERIAKKVCQLYDNDTPQVLAEILSEFTSFVVGKPDHGLYSSLIMQNFLRYALADEEVDSVSIAIALHNDDVARLITQVIGPQTFERDPLSFLLAFCDLAQDWGRIRPLGIDRSGYGRFGYPVYASDSLFDPATNTIRVVLCYERPFSVQERKDWTENIYLKYIGPTRDCWAVSSSGRRELNFCIEYQNQTTSKDGLVLRRLDY